MPLISIKLTTLFVIIALSVVTTVTNARHSWERPGCHRLAHSRRVQIPGCIAFHVKTNACRGYCLSWAYPSPSNTRDANPNHIITSRAECCSIDETHDVKVRVRCIDGFREIVFKSARSCACSICRRS
ncbi:thyrostimulin alpha-2 subunit-like [Gigantopelta aegis]|uniref:thyrostimulin alpha-2 subunit-like n=1 Tax=Gigantopelta aegis TaxID=1735272 RepID=UPI001B8874E8|nr:thyrostimulin alpha-2 subunit-like [Gigantopelta aegis]XP_041351878.1 thyrostimulin alpha-2 subunit-like [Gigantopelta aegis]